MHTICVEVYVSVDIFRRRVLNAFVRKRLSAEWNIWYLDVFFKGGPPSPQRHSHDCAGSSSGGGQQKLPKLCAGRLSVGGEKMEDGVLKLVGLFTGPSRFFVS